MQEAQVEAFPSLHFGTCKNSQTNTSASVNSERNYCTEFQRGRLNREINWGLQHTSVLFCSIAKSGTCSLAMRDFNERERASKVSNILCTRYFFSRGYLWITWASLYISFGFHAYSWQCLSVFKLRECIQDGNAKTSFKGRMNHNCRIYYREENTMSIFFWSSRNWFGSSSK